MKGKMWFNEKENINCFINYTINSNNDWYDVPNRQKKNER